MHISYQGLNDRPKACFKIIDISNINSKSAKEFYFEFSGRKFELRCSNELDKLKWINALEFLLDHIKNKSVKENKDLVIPITPKDDKSDILFSLIINVISID